MQNGRCIVNAQKVKSVVERLTGIKGKNATPVRKNLQNVNARAAEAGIVTTLY